MNIGVAGFSNVVYIHGIPDKEAAALLAALAFKHGCVFNLLYNQTTDAPYIVFYTNDPVDLINDIRGLKCFKRYLRDFRTHITGNKYFKRPTVINEDDDMDESPF